MSGISARMLQAAAGAGGAGGWELSEAVYSHSYPKISFSAKDTQPRSLFFKPDGLKLYVVGSQYDNVYEFDLATAWDISTAEYVRSFSVGSQDSFPRGLFFKADGTRMFIVGDTNNNLYQYDLTTAWDISSASYTSSNDIGGGSSEGNPTGLFFKPDGTRIYFAGEQGNKIYQAVVYYPWGTGLIYSYSELTSSYEGNPTDVTFNDDGTKMYLVGDSNRRVVEYSLSTAYNITTASFVRYFAISSADVTSPASITFKSDGTEMYISDGTYGEIVKYSLSTAWNISTASIVYPTEDYLSVKAQETTVNGVDFKPDGTKMYIVGSSGDDVNEYSLSSAWQISSASFVQSFSVSAQETIPRDVKFKPDGTKMYIVGASGDDVNEYSLSSAWDVSTATFSQNFSVASQEGAPHGLFFKDDGTKMYVVGSQYDQVREYNLSTAWNISTASYSQGFSVASQDSLPTAVSFKYDGTKMYVAGDSSNDVLEYDLTTAWDVSTASYLQNFHILYDFQVNGLFMKPTGGKMFIVGTWNDVVLAYDL